LDISPLGFLISTIPTITSGSLGFCVVLFLRFFLCYEFCDFSGQLDLGFLFSFGEWSFAPNLFFIFFLTFFFKKKNWF